jgi:hypothetical protein
MRQCMRKEADMLHFVGFTGEEYLSACRVFGMPDFIHRGYDLRALREIAPGDTVIFATGHAGQAPRNKSFDDLREKTIP